MCKVEWCTNKPNPSGKGYCRRHYDQIRKYGRILPKRTKSNPNDVILLDDHAEIVLRDAKGRETARALIDLEDVERVRKHKWSLNDKGYVRCRVRGKTVYLHRFLLGAEPGQEVDHINLNKLDNRKRNLRFCEHVQNCWNRASTNRGVRMVRGRNLTKKFHAKITVNGVTKHLGYYLTPEEALEARLKAEEEFFGEFRCRVG